ncbi:hypothetical protein D3C76_951790 [compost metagenome]
MFKTIEDVVIPLNREAIKVGINTKRPIAIAKDIAKLMYINISLLLSPNLLLNHSSNLEGSSSSSKKLAE